MKFSTRNAFYLRASNYRVIPLFLYLDERHVDWMSDGVLQLVIQELQPKMPELLLHGRHEKKHKVYVERGEGYQYCFFLRTTTRTEVVLLKQKSYSLRPPTPPPRSTPLRQASARPSRKRKSRTSRSRSRSISLAGSSVDGGGDGDMVEEVKDEPPPTPRAGLNGDEEEDDVEINVKDWKPDVDVSYKGFGTSSVQLVLIIEPYPPLPASQYAPPSSRLSTRSASIATSRSRSRQVGTGLQRGSRYSTSSSVLPDDRSEALPPLSNMRNPTRSMSTNGGSSTPIPNSRRGGTSTPALGSTPTPFGRNSVTPSLSREGRESTGGSIMDRSETPLFIRADTDFDEEDEEAHEEYTIALKQGRLRLPSVSRPAGTPAPDGMEFESGRRSVRRSVDIDDDEDDVPESLGAMSQRLVRSSEIEERFTRVQGGWEERLEGEESAVMGREEPGD